MVVRRRFRRRRYRLRRRRYQRRIRRYVRTRRYRTRRKSRKGGVLRKMLRALLPEIPIKYCQVYSGTGSFGSRTWLSTTIGSVNDIYTYRDQLPGLSNLYDDGTTGTSTHLSFQQFASKKFKARHKASYIGQNVGNATMFLTIHICKFRHDYVHGSDPAVTSIMTDCATSTNSGSGLVNATSTLPGSGYIGNYYNYPQFTVFSSSNFVSTYKVVKTHRLRVGPGDWFKFKLNSGYKEFDKSWLTANNSETLPIRHMKGWSKTAVLTWHGELAMKTGTLTSQTLTANDIIMYANHSLKLKAVPFLRKSTIYNPPVYLDTASPMWQPVVRPRGIVQVTETTTNAEQKG